MNPSINIQSDHVAMSIILDAMENRAHEILKNGNVDYFRIGQILDFLHNYTDNLHYAKEEKILFPAVMDVTKPWISKIINNLVYEHELAREYIKEIDKLLHSCLDGNTDSLRDLASGMLKYVELEKNHIKVEDEVVMPLFKRLLETNKLDGFKFEFKDLPDKKIDQLKYLEYYRLINILSTENIYGSKPGL
jgi:hemerythrin-like domain-containing protein